MASKTKDNYTPRFNFGGNLDPLGEQTGTIKELLSELNYENDHSLSGAFAEKVVRRTVPNDNHAGDNADDSIVETITAESLERTLRFIRQATGRTFSGTTKPLSLSALKTIKLLYTKDDDSRIQLFRCITRPGNGEDPTMEFHITEGSTRNDYVVKIVNELIDTLALDIDDTRLRKIETSLLTSSKLLQCIERENADILGPIYRQFGSDSNAFTDALRFLTASIADHRPRTWETSRSLSELLYTYLRTLPFFHWVGEVTTATLKQAAIAIPVAHIHEEIEQFCRSLSTQTGEDIHGDTPVTSIDHFPAFATQHVVAFSKLIESATSIRSERRDLLRILDEANKVLHAYVFHQWHRTPTHVINLSVTDCVAALCTIRHQQKVKTTYTASWIGQDQYEQTTTRLLSHLGDDRPIDELYDHDYIPQGATQILHYRFAGFHAAFAGLRERHQAWLDFQMVRLQRYADCLVSNDVDCINRELSDFHSLCQLYAIQAARRGDDEGTEDGDVLGGPGTER
jgi:hypothetical protein